MVSFYSGATQSDMSVSVPSQYAFRKYILAVFNMRIKIISIANGCLSEYKIDVLHELNVIHYFPYCVKYYRVFLHHILMMFFIYITFNAFTSSDGSQSKYRITYTCLLFLYWNRISCSES